MGKIKKEVSNKARTMSKPGITRCGNTEFHWGERTYVMGIINVSPDSFSGDGTAEAEAKQGKRTSCRSLIV